MKSFYFAILTAVVWGITPIIEKIGLTSKTMDPVAGVIFRSIGSFLAGVILFFIVLKYFPSSLKNVEHKAIYFLMTGGILASVIGQVFFYISLKGGNASVVTPISGTYPLITFILGVFLLGETVNIQKILGVVFIVLGVIFLK